ncbi:hypothetical protein [Sphingomonas sp.]|uniref:hypothetical protein n=1 Tax=Sphingomonas sp. TaxID=28214 RepID=UPI0025E96CE8|nr:hypothetical protein [Sphingomonas sp.]
MIRLVVMMYVRFPLSLRNVEDLLFERGIDKERRSAALAECKWPRARQPLSKSELHRGETSSL